LEGQVSAAATIIEYFGYLPHKGGRRAVLLAALAVFISGYLVLAASSIAVALHLFPLWVVVTVLACDCGLHHAARALEGEWWVAGDVVREGVTLRITDTFGNIFLWMQAHACPMLSLRHPDYVGPQGTARIVVCAFFEGAFVVVAALALPTDNPMPATHDANASLAGQAEAREEASRIMAWRICLPALCVALTALATFFADLLCGSGAALPPLVLCA
jgi:hypothetical protein